MGPFSAGASAIATSSSVLEGLPPRPMIRTRSHGFDEYMHYFTWFADLSPTPNIVAVAIVNPPSK